jgi:hypothetical protein
VQGLEDQEFPKEKDKIYSEAKLELGSLNRTKAE